MTRSSDKCKSSWIRTTQRALACVGLLVHIACSSSTSPAVPSKAEATTKTGGRSGALWPEYELKEEGLFARFPKPPRESRHRGEQQDAPELHAWEMDDGNEWFSVLRFRDVQGRRYRESKLAEICRPRMKWIDAEGEATFGESRGVEYRGNISGVTGVLRCFVIRDSVLALMAGARRVYDPDAAESFLASVRLEMPWKEDRVTSGKFSASVPSWSALVSRDTSGSVEGTENGRWLGGVNEVAYWYSATPIREEDRERAPEELIDRYVATLTPPYERQVPVGHDGLPGRDVFRRGLRGRFLVGPTHLYSMAVHANAPERLTGPDAERFFGSFRRFESN